MLIFSDEQHGQIAKEFQLQQPRRLLRRLRENNADIPKNMSEQDTLEMIETITGEAKQLNIYEEDNIFRLLKLSFWRLSHTIEQKKANLIAMTLSNVDASEYDRMDFIENRIIHQKL